MSFQIKKSSLFLRIISLIIVVTFTFTSVIPPSYAQSVLNLPTPGTMVSLSPSYTPAIMTGMTIFPDNPFQFDFIINIGDDRLQGEALKKESEKLIRYFMATLTVPEDEMWVNLSPYEKDRIIADGLSQTEMGRDMLAQDYLLKQLTASLMYPEDELGSKFWKRVYKKAQEKYGTTDIPTNTFNKIWIVPEEATVYINDNTIFVMQNRLKVLLEEDYLALENHTGIPSKPAEDETLSVSTEIIREDLISEIEKEVNEGKNFANLRQIYNSLILAAWYKQNLKESFIGKIYADQNKTNGIDLNDPTIHEKIYEQYLEAFKKGVYNYIKEDYDPTTQQIIPRKYFSGGAHLKTGRVGVEEQPLADRVQLSRTRTHVKARVRTDVLSKDGSDRAMVADLPASFGQAIRGKRFVLSNTVAGKLKFAYTHEEELVEAISRIDVNLTDPRFGAKLKAAVRKVAQGQSFENFEIPYTLPEKWSEARTFLMIPLLAIEPHAIESVDEVKRGLEVINQQGATIIPHSVITNSSVQQLRYILTHEEHHAIWARLSENSPDQIKKFEDLYEELLEEAETLEFTEAALANLRADGYDANNVRELFFERIGSSYKPFIAEEFWIYAASDYLSEEDDTNLQNLPMNVVDAVYALIELVKRDAQESNRPLFERLEKAIAQSKLQHKQARNEAEKDMVELSRASLFGSDGADDRAMVGEEARKKGPTSDKATLNQNEVGGIDFNPNNLNLKTQGTEFIFDTPTTLQNIQASSINGLAPVIINITPINSVLPLLGLEPRKEEELEVSSLN